MVPRISGKCCQNRLSPYYFIIEYLFRLICFQPFVKDKCIVCEKFDIFAKRAEFAGEIVEKMPKTIFSKIQKIGVRPIGLTPRMYVLKLPD